MDNHALAALLTELALGLDFLDEPFKARAYRKAAESVAVLTGPVRARLEDGRIMEMEGIGKGIAATLHAWEIDQDFSALEEVRARIPAGLSELLKVPGLGMTKLRLMHALGIETLEDLQAACDEGTLVGIKGFTPRYIARMRRATVDIMAFRGQFFLDVVRDKAQSLCATLAEAGIRAAVTGACRRGAETLSAVDILVEDERAAMQTLDRIMGDPDIVTDQTLTYLRGGPGVDIHIAPAGGFAATLFLTTGSAEHVARIREIARGKGIKIRREGFFPRDLTDEQALYDRLGMQYVPPELRETGAEIDLAQRQAIPRLVTEADIVGTLHNHTSYSDGHAPLKDLVTAAQALGYAWIGISDHSLSARYAGGMNLKTVRRQHAEIDALNEAGGIAVLKGVECDIQADGSLDYPEAVLASFDFVIASIHTQMDMERDAMTARICAALRHPHTAMLGHPTGRLLLSRAAYAVDMDVVLEEALRQKVVIELNAHPWRLDLDWRLIAGFTAAGGIIAIGPDAHELRGLTDMRHGVLIGRKGMLAPERCLNTYPIERVREVLQRC